MIPIAVLQAFLFLQAAVLTEYFELDALGSWSHPARDGWCGTQDGESVGVHCFGDYAYVYRAVEDATFWEPPYSFGYPAAAIAPAAFSFLVARAFDNYLVGLFFYLLLLFLSLAAVWIFLVLPNQKFTASDKVLALFSVGPFSLPSLIALDRGNTVGFFVPALLFLLIGVMGRSWGFIAIGIVVAGLLKPQFVLLLLLLLVYRKWRLFFYASISLAALHGLAYLLLVGEIITPLYKTVQVALGFSDDLGGAPRFRNVSISGSLQGAESLLFGTSSVSWDLVGVVFALAVVVWLFLFGKRLDQGLSLVLLLVLANLAVPVAFAYYLLFAQGVLILAGSAHLSVPGVFRPTQLSRTDQIFGRIVRVLLFVSVLSSLTGLLLPSVVVGEGLVSTSLRGAGLVWTTFVLAVIFQNSFLAIRRFSGKHKPVLD